MNDLNQVSVIGRLTRDQELKYTQSGTAVMSLSIAVNRSVKQGEQWVDVPSYFDVSVWGKQAETLNQFLHKGKQIGVMGHLEQQRWQAQDGSNRSRVVIMAENVQLLGGNEQNGQPRQQNYQNQNYQQPNQTPPQMQALQNAGLVNQSQYAQQYQQQNYGQQDFPEQIPF